MKKVTVKTKELLQTLKENRQNHRAAFEKALEGFRATVTEELEKRYQDAREGKRYAHWMNIPEPVDQTPEYDIAIKMLEMSVDIETELTHQEFSCYVMDRWSWKSNFATTNSAYIEKTGATRESFGRALDLD